MMAEAVMLTECLPWMASQKSIKFVPALIGYTPLPLVLFSRVALAAALLACLLASISEQPTNKAQPTAMITSSTNTATNTATSNATTSSSSSSSSDPISHFLSLDSCPSSPLSDISSDSPASYSPAPLPPWCPFLKQSSVPLPDEIFSPALLERGAECHMGLLSPAFPCAWISVDHTLFLWNFSHSHSHSSTQALSTFDSLPPDEKIHSVSLAWPKGEIFTDSVQHLLVVCTSAAVHLLGISSSAADDGQVSIYLTGMTAPLEYGMRVSAVCQMPRQRSAGRIFLACGASAYDYSASLLELNYQLEEGWFSKKCSLSRPMAAVPFGIPLGLPSFLKSGAEQPHSIVQIVQSPASNALYTLSSKSVIECFYLGKLATGISRQSAIHDVRAVLINRLAPLTPALAAALDPKSFRVVRISVIPPEESKLLNLLAVTNTGIRIYLTHSRSGSPVPSSLEVMHVRLPPPGSDTLNTQTALCSGSNAVMIGIKNDEIDTFLLASSVPNQRPMAELYAQTMVDGRTWDVTEAALPDPEAVLVSANGWMLSELSRLDRPAWNVLTNMGMHTFAKVRPVDTLVGLLESGQLSDLGNFFTLYGVDQVCAMALSIACGNYYLNDGGTNMGSAEASNSARRLYHEYGGRPTSVDRGFPAGTVPGSAPANSVVFSGRHDGLGLYAARLLRPIWQKHLIKLSAPHHVSNISPTTLQGIQKQLINLVKLLESNSHLLKNNAALTDSRDKLNFAAWTAEQTSISNIQLLLTRSIEAISFILLLIDYNLDSIVNLCPRETKIHLESMTYCSFLTSSVGQDVARTLVNEVINQQIAKHTSVDSISDLLQQRCGSFCSADDVLLYKASDSLRVAKSLSDQNERREVLRESARLFLKGCKHLELEKLKGICKEFRELEFVVGAVDLPLMCAEIWDSDKYGLEYYNAGKPSVLGQGKEMYDKRIACYACVLQALGDAEKKPKTQFNEIYKHNLYSRALESEDPCFHANLYDWLMQQDLTDKLLDIRTPFIETHLLSEPMSLEKYRFVWQYYVQQERYVDAARVLSSLAESNDYPLSLPERLQYLSGAVTNLKSNRASANSGGIVEMLTDVEEKLEVAQVQLEVWRAVGSLNHLESSQKETFMKKLQTSLLTISELYAEFAQPLGLDEITLLILHTSDHHDTYLVNTTWDSIIRRAHESAAKSAHEAVAAVIVALGRRFYPSDNAFPLEYLLNELEEYNVSIQETEHPEKGWLLSAFRDAGVSDDSVFLCLKTLYENRSPPWHSEEMLSFLLTEITCLLEEWLTSLSKPKSVNTALFSSFPAHQVDQSIGEYLSSTTDAEVRQKLTDCRKIVRSQF